MSSRRRFLLIFCFIILDMFLLIGFLVIRDATYLNDLKKEVNELSKLNIAEDRYNRRIKSGGDYAIVEKAIKDYLDDYAVNLQEVLQVIQDSKLTTILSYENYSTDGATDFRESLEYIATTKSSFNKKIDGLIDKLKEESISDYINDKTTDPYYINLYLELMLEDNMANEFDEAESLLKKTKIRVNNVFDVSSEVLNFLIINKGSWTTEDGEIKFLTTELYNQYNSLIAKISGEQNSEYKNPVNS